MATSRICSIPDCDKPHYGRGWCLMHYKRWRSHGDATAGRTPNGETERYFKDVVLRHEDNTCLMWPYLTLRGYAIMHAPPDGQMQYVSRIVCGQAKGPPPTPAHEAAHSCGNGHKGCVAKRHLSWKTPKQNAKDKIAHGTHLCGANANGAKLTEDDVRSIRTMKGHPSTIANEFSVSVDSIRHILNGKTWAWLE